MSKKRDRDLSDALTVRILENQWRHRRVFQFLVTTALADEITMEDFCGLFSQHHSRVFIEERDFISKNLNYPAQIITKQTITKLLLLDDLIQAGLMVCGFYVSEKDPGYNAGISIGLNESKRRLRNLKIILDELIDSAETSSN